MLTRLKIWFSIVFQKIKQPLKRSKIKQFLNKESEVILDLPIISLPKKGTLIVKTDDIGDYLVWQHTWQYYKTNCTEPLYFVGNSVWQPLFEKLNLQTENTFWIDKKQWGNTEYRQFWYKKIRLLNVETAITPLFTRNNQLDDLLILASNANKTIGWQNTNELHKLKIFKHQIASKTISQIEYFRNIEFVNQVFNLKIPYEIKPIVPLEARENTLLLFPVANSKSRCWAVENYIQLLQKIESKFNAIYLMGGTDSVDTNSQIETALNLEKIKNYSRKTSLLETIEMVNKSRLVICPDTAALHIAVLTNTPAIAISNGSNALRFVNYPKGVQAIYPPYFKLNPYKEKTFYSRSEIGTIKVEEVAILFHNGSDFENSVILHPARAGGFAKL